MYDGGKIGAGLLIFFLMVTFPFFVKMGGADRMPDPKIDTPVINKMVKKQCVEPKEFMRAEHMQLLNDWRDSALRDGKRYYQASDGKTYAISVQNTCFDCHSNKKKFCDECHNYMAVKPYCWDCHLVPEEKEL